MKTVNQLINRAGTLTLNYSDDDIVGISVGELSSLTRKITELRSLLQTAEKSIAHQRNLASSIYAQAMLECDKNKFEELV